jgi:hypothetical protein
MAFPGELNISYYKGDTYEFNVYPKKNDGTVFSLDGYSIKFTIALTRGATSIIEGYAAISSDNTYATCAITPGAGASMTAGTQYVYDVEVKKSATPYNLVHTLLTGTVTVTEQVTPAGA